MLQFDKARTLASGKTKKKLKPTRARRRAAEMRLRTVQPAAPPAPQVAPSEGETMEQRAARILLTTEKGNALVASHFCQAGLKELRLDPNGAVGALREKVAAVRSGDMSGLEAMLVSQAVAAEAIANELLRRASETLGTHLQATETYLRLGLKAQANSRANIEALVEMKNPRPVAFINAKQANLANGPQQVNNGTAPAGRPRRAETENPSNKLLVGRDDERMD